MANNLAVTPGSGATVATDDRSSVHFPRVIDTGAELLASGRVSVTTTSGEAVAARSLRRGLYLYAPTTNTATIDIGPSGVASGSGFPLVPGMAVTLAFAGSLHADAASGTQVLCYIEEYDT